MDSRALIGTDWELMLDMRVPGPGDPEADDLYWRIYPPALQVGRMGYRVMTVEAGPIKEVMVYPIWGRSWANTARASRKNVTPERMARANAAAAVKKFTRLINANFGPRDQHVTLTYAGEAPDWQTAHRDMQNFIRRMQRQRRRKGLPDAGYVYVLEDSDGYTQKRIHIHLVTHGGLSREEIEACWKKGRTNADRLQPDGEWLTGLAKYMLKTNRADRLDSEENGRRRWYASKGLKKPKTRVNDSKLSRRRVVDLAEQLPAVWPELTQKAYPGYQTIEEPEVWRSERVPGVFVRWVMRRTDGRAEP